MTIAIKMWIDDLQQWTIQLQIMFPEKHMLIYQQNVSITALQY